MERGWCVGFLSECLKERLSGLLKMLELLKASNFLSIFVQKIDQQTNSKSINNKRMNEKSLFQFLIYLSRI